MESEPSEEWQNEPMERYPKTVGLVRHAESRYNELKKIIVNWPSFKVFNARFKDEYYADAKTQKVRDDLDIAVLEGRWPSPELQGLAIALYAEVRKLMQGVSDYDTPITDKGWKQSKEVGAKIADHMPKPDIIYVSPYLRTRQTLQGILENAPADWKNVQTWENESIREQEHGMQTVFNDWRLSFVFEPMEMLHYLKQGPYSYRYKGGESKFDVRNRTSRFVGRMRRKHTNENVLAVSHHLTILATLAELLHWSREDFMRWDEERRPDNCGITIFRQEKGASRTGRDLLRLKEEDYSRKLYT